MPPFFRAHCAVSGHCSREEVLLNLAPKISRHLKCGLESPPNTYLPFYTKFSATSTVVFCGNRFYLLCCSAIVSQILKKLQMQRFSW